MTDARMRKVEVTSMWTKERVFRCGRCGRRAIGQTVDNTRRIEMGYKPKSTLPVGWKGADSKRGVCLCSGCAGRASGDKGFWEGSTCRRTGRACTGCQPGACAARKPSEEETMA